MEKLNPRFWSSETKEWRELIAIKKNGYGDIVLTLDGGEVWQYTPHQEKTPLFERERLKLCGRGVISSGPKVGQKPLYCFLILKDPEEKFTGNLKIIKQEKMSDEKPNTPKKRQAVTIKDSALICEVSEATIKNWDKKGAPTTAGVWPGRNDVVALKSFAATRKSRKETKAAIRGMIYTDKIDKFGDRSHR